MRKLMAYPNDSLIVPEETLEDRISQLMRMENEYKTYRKAFREKHKHLVESIKTLKEIISDEVIKNGKTVIVGNMMVEFVPTVAFKKKKEETDEQ